MRKSIIIPALAITIVGTGVLASNKIFAQSTVTANPMSTVVQKIADKFGLNTTDVQAVFDQDRTDRQAEMETKYENQLTQFVTDGKITEAQKQLILSKHKELEAARQTERQRMEGMTDDERKAAMEANRTKMETERSALEEWASQNGIDMQYIMGFGMHGGHGPGMGFRPQGGQVPAAVQQ